jgi:hypothetical protein
MKKCSYCAELIKGDAKVCQYCGNLLYNKLSENSQQTSVFSSMRLILSRFIGKITKYYPAYKSGFYDDRSEEGPLSYGCIELLY